jgi:hypothetical protein
MLAVLGLVAGLLAGLLHLLGIKAGIVEWCLIFGVILVAAHCCFYGRAWYRWGAPPA